MWGVDSLGVNLPLKEACFPSFPWTVRQTSGGEDSIHPRASGLSDTAEPSLGLG